MNKKNFKLKNKAQGTIEYLVIIAIVVVIALIVVALVLNISNTDSTQIISNKNQNLIGKGGISIVDTIISSSGDGVISLQNTSGENLTITSITPGAEYTCEKLLSSMDKYNCYLTDIDTACPCSTGQKVTCDFKITFKSKEGIQKSETFTITNDCTDQTITDPNPPTNITYTITFDSQGGTPDLPSITEIEEGSIITLPTNPTKTGYTFLEWNTQADGEGTPFIEITPVTNNITLYAQWIINQYTITFDSDGGTAVQSITQNYNTSIIPQANPTKTGYTFVEWNPELPTTMPANNQTLTAQWESTKYTITYDANNGTGTVPTDSTQYGSGASVTILSQGNLVRNGYTFSNWKNNSNGQTYNPEQTLTITQNTTLHAQWTPVIITQVSNCTQLQNMSQNLSGNYELISNINCSGFTFTPIGNSTNKFTGTLNGNYYKIINLQITNSGNVQNIGLFGYIENATISKLVMENTSINGYMYIGSIAGTAKNSTISECGATVNVNTGAFERGLNYGGIVGKLEGGLIDKCFMTGTINTQGYAPGGIAGYLAGGTISNCYVNGNLTASREGAAGIVGTYTNGPTSEIKNSYTRGTATAGYSGYAAGIVSTVWDTGTNLTINDSYSTANVVGLNKGGIISSSKATINNSYYTTNGNFNYGTKVDDPTLFLENSHAVYSEWDFETIWSIDSGRNDGYPYLRWEDEIN